MGHKKDEIRDTLKDARDVIIELVKRVDDPEVTCKRILGEIENALEAPLLYSNETTSKAASFSNVPVRGTQRWIVLNAIATRHGLTDEELEKVTGFPHNTETPRRYELEKGGWIEDSGRKRKTTHGKDAIVWVLTPWALNQKI